MAFLAAWMAAGVIMSGLMLATGRGLPKPRLWGALALLGFLMNIVGNGFVGTPRN